MSIKFTVMLSTCFLLGGLVTAVHASGTSSSSASWGKVTSDQSPDDSDQNSDVSQNTVPSNQENLLVSVDTSLSDAQKKSAVALYDQGMEANKSGDYQKAKGLFEQALSINSDNPDILNMLAHTQLKVGLIDEALKNYKKALELRPRFPEAREYLGETYIQAALRELTTLKSYGADGTEQAEDLEQEIKNAGKGV